MRPDLSFVLPVYKCADCIGEIHRQLTTLSGKLSLNIELIFVNDGSPDQSWGIITALSSRDQRVRGIHLSRNFGQHFAILAGLDSAKGEWVLIMDCDLEDLPEEALRMYQKAQEGFDIVWGRRMDRQHSLLKQLASKLFYKAFNAISDFNRDPRIGNFVCFNSNVLAAVKSLREQTRFVPALLDWVGFRTHVLDVRHGSRFAGSSSYSFSKLIRLAFDALISHSLKPLHVILKLGLLISLASFVLVGQVIYKYLNSGISVSGWTTIMVAIGLSTGFTVSILGIIGIYVGKIFVEVKARPLYLIKATTGFKKVERESAA